MSGELSLSGPRLALGGEVYARANRGLVALLGQSLSDVEIPSFVLDRGIAYQINLLDIDKPPFRINGQSWAGTLLSTHDPGGFTDFLIGGAIGRDDIAVVLVESITLDAAPGLAYRLGFVAYAAAPWAPVPNTGRVYLLEPRSEVVAPTGANSLPLSRETQVVVFGRLSTFSGAVDGVDYNELTGDLRGTTRVEFTDGECTLWPGMGLAAMSQGSLGTVAPVRVTASGRLWQFGQKTPTP